MEAMRGAVAKNPGGAASAEARRALRSELRGQVLVLGGTLAVLWLLELLDFVVFHGRLDELGVRARTVRGLIGIPLHPFLHAGFGHLAANSVGMVLPGWFIVNRRRRDFFLVWALATLVGGLGTWLVAPSGRVDIGASGVVLGLMGFLIARGVFERRFLTILGSVAMVLLWGGTIRAGLFPNDPHVSWQIHLFGLVGGVLAARLVRRKRGDGQRPPSR
jgi:membrane associated rhomboid family serine protease